MLVSIRNTLCNTLKLLFGRIIDVCVYNILLIPQNMINRYAFILSACHIEFHHNSFTSVKDEESDKKFTKCSLSGISFLNTINFHLLHMSFDSFIK